MEEFVAERLLRGDKAAKTQAAVELSNLSRKQRHKLAERGVISPLISILHSQDHNSIEAALSALLSLAFGSERNKVLIVKSGAVPILIEILQSETRTAIVELAMAFLLILSSCNKNKPKIASSGVIQLLVRLIGCTDALSVQANADAISTLHNLSTHRHIIPMIISAGATYALLKVINFSDKSSELAEKAAALLENTTAHSPDSASCIEGAIGVLVEAIEEGSAQCKEHAVGILLRVCKWDRETYRGMILREGVMPGLLQVSVDGTWRGKEMARELLLLLRDSSGSGYGFKGKQSKKELVEEIMREIDEGGEEIHGGTTLRLVEEMIARLSST
ncbi:PREDICTED: U-box domain-containing protein 2 [Tarenaya hassleriana]|uniref:U-box domain-containing protein 2 n=1 Tax=Tarenaya hassleriana TaxID=28532 RepID=UPI00053C1AE1|nr:PREDICTED: U-box domain-containing protein 2 [Tarenaya hassleriana]